ncbi:MAG: hypothetical protein DWQ10_18410 [Calditrichaeota bacterium]|nr:MAG: hypothetical protein DWQ10_18410 [Calditrichota bacterium]
MFKSVKMFFVFRIAFFLLLGIGCYLSFGLQQSTFLPEFPNLWEVIITTVGGASLAMASFYWSRFRLLGRIDDSLMGEVDQACNDLINADDPGKLKPYGNVFTPKLLVEQVGVFGQRILKTFCRKQIFHYVEGGVFSIKDPILPLHPRSIYPEALRNAIDPVLYNFIDVYLKNLQEGIIIFRTDRSNKVNRITDENDKILAFDSKELKTFIDDGFTLPHKNAILTPIFLKNRNIGYLLLFYKSQNAFSKWINPREMIDNYMLKKIEDWKLDDVIQSIIEKERLLLSFYLEKIIDDVTTPQIRPSLFAKNKMDFPETCEKILEAICKLLKIEKGGFLYHNATDGLVRYAESLSEEIIHGSIVPYTKSLLAANNRKVSSFKTGALEALPENVDFKNVIYVKIEHNSRELGLLGLFANRELDEFDKFVLDIIEDIKLDDLFLLYK